MRHGYQATRTIHERLVSGQSCNQRQRTAVLHRHAPAPSLRPSRAAVGIPCGLLHGVLSSQAHMRACKRGTGTRPSLRESESHHGTRRASGEGPEEEGTRNGPEEEAMSARSLRLTLATVLLATAAGAQVTCTSDPECADTNLCNGTEVCAGGVCQPGTPLDCNDNNAATTDTCDAALGCQHAATIGAKRLALRAGPTNPLKEIGRASCRERG